MFSQIERKNDLYHRVVRLFWFRELSIWPLLMHFARFYQVSSPQLYIVYRSLQS